LNDRNRQLRRKSMYGTVLFLVGLIAAIASVVTRSLWLAVAAAVILVPGGAMLYQVGKSLPPRR
jgi:fatty acid desaturase